MSEQRRIRVLFLCTGNSCRSQMAEAILRHVGGERFKACSAGSHPAGFIHPLAVDTLAAMKVPMVGQRSKSWDEFADATFDAVITLCDDAASEPCPVFRGAPVIAHWSTPDPALAEGTQEERMALALSVGRRLASKIEELVKIDFNAPMEEVAAKLRFLGEI